MRSNASFYAYSAYGEATTLGPDGENSLQFTGRENDGTGLYYYRARTFDPVLKRFSSEDPIGINGGINLYEYGRSNPVSYSDPTGNVGALVIAGGAVAAVVIVGGTAIITKAIADKVESVIGLITKSQDAPKLQQKIADAYDKCVRCKDDKACAEYVRLSADYFNLVGGATNAGAGASNASTGPLPGQVGGAAGQIIRSR